jgi:hypothetical protein
LEERRRIEEFAAQHALSRCIAADDERAPQWLPKQCGLLRLSMATLNDWHYWVRSLVCAA